jgi:hypothetical protein
VRASPMRRRSLNPHSRISSISHAGSAGLFADRVRVLAQKPVKIRCEVYLFPVDRGKLRLVATHLVRIKKSRGEIACERKNHLSNSKIGPLYRA